MSDLVDGGQPSLDELVETLSAPIIRRRREGADIRDRIQPVLQRLVEYFGVDFGFLRRHDHDRRVTVLVAEWPERPVLPDPDPLGVIRFDDADPVFRSTENLSDVMVTRPNDEAAQYLVRVLAGSGIAAVSSVTVPLLVGDRTAGVLGFIKVGDRKWTEEEIDALRGVAGFLSF